MEKVTIKDIAREARVSFKTVSRVINGEKFVTEEKQTKVNAAIKKLQYQPNLIARELAAHSTKLIAFFFFCKERIFPREYYFTEIFDSAQRELIDKGYSVLFFSPGISVNCTEFVLETVRQRRVSGIILADLVGCNYKRFKSVMVPVISFHRNLLDRNISVVSPCNKKGAYEATRYLFSLGHEKIGFLGKMPSRQSSVERIEGYQDACKEAGFTDYEDFIYPVVDNSPESAEMAVKELLEKGKALPTAIFAFTDTLAIGAMRTFQHAGFSVPENISISGFDDIEIASMVTPALTTVSVARGEMGSLAAKKLLRMIENKKRGELIEVETRLVIRDSTAPCVEKDKRRAEKCAR